MVFEILSPSTRGYDLLVKALKYEQIGVKEYWIIDPKNRLIIVPDYVNQEGHTYQEGNVVASKMLGFTIAVNDIF